MIVLKHKPSSHMRVLVSAINALQNAAVAKSWAGSAPPYEQKEIESRYLAAREDVKAQLTYLDLQIVQHLRKVA